MSDSLFLLLFFGQAVLQVQIVILWRWRKAQIKVINNQATVLEAFDSAFTKLGAAPKARPERRP